MKYLTLLLIAAALLVTACTSQATPVVEATATESSVADMPTEQPTATQAPTETEEAYPEPESEATAPAEVAEAYPEPEAAAAAAESAVAYPEPEAETDESAQSAIIFTIVPEESYLSYEVGETFISDNNRFSTAIGVTTDIAGEITVDPENPQNSTLGTVTADISKFKSDSNRRDSKIQNDFLESAKFPMVTFVPAEFIGLPENPQAGETYNFQVVGDTTIRETTLPLTFDVTLTVTDEMVTGEATTTFLMSEFGFGPISIAGILNTEDEVKINFSFVARP